MSLKVGLIAVLAP